MESKNKPQVFNSVSELHRALGLAAPQHPLISISNYADITADVSELSKAMVLNMYKISFKFNFTGRIKYGQKHYDFDSGGLSFSSPMQVISAGDGESDYTGRSLIIHSDFLRNYPLMRTIKDFGFFSYSVNEALHLSETEKSMIMKIFESIESELSSTIDNFSQDIIISQIEQLLNYSNRFYNRQFITRKTFHNDHLSKLDQIISDFLDNDNALIQSVPSISYLAEQIGVSQRYLSDMLQSLTGMNSQQYLQSKMIEKARILLSTTPLTVGEIAYKMGFEHPQSFSKFFKKQTELSPIAFRNSFN